MNDKLPDSAKLLLDFSNGWLFQFKKRYHFQAHKCHGESGDADEEAIQVELPSLSALIAMYKPNDIFNADEFGLFYRQAPDITIGSSPVKGKKKRKDRMTFLACSNCDGTELIPPMAVGSSKNPKCFNGKRCVKLGIDCHSRKKSWMNRNLFNAWLLRLDNYIGRIANRRVLLLVDNAFCHGQASTLPDSNCVEVLFLPKSTTSRLQPLDARVIAVLKKQYRKGQIERAIDRIDRGITENLYHVDLLTAITDAYNIWHSIDGSIIYNCWLKTGLVRDLLNSE